MNNKIISEQNNNIDTLNNLDNNQEVFIDETNKKLSREQKALKRKVYRQKVKANKKYIHNRTINKNLDKQSPIDDNLCIQAQQVWKIIAYKDKRYDLIKGIDLNIYKNDFMMVFGESGSGKTTLLSLLSALDRPSEGNVNILGNNTSTLKNNQLVKLRNNFIGYIFQQYGLLKEVSVLENIIITLSSKEQNRILRLNSKYKKIENSYKRQAQKQLNFYHKHFINFGYLTNNYPISYCYYYFYNQYYSGFDIMGFINDYLEIDNNLKNKLKIVRDEIFNNEFVYEIMKKLEIDHLMNYKINALSGGQQQRVSISRAIVKKPKILFADEPTGAVDAKTAKIIMEIFLWLNKECKTTIIIVTHNNNLINLANHIVIIENGNVLSDEMNSPLDINEISFE